MKIVALHYTTENKAKKKKETLINKKYVNVNIRFELHSKYCFYHYIKLFNDLMLIRTTLLIRTAVYRAYRQTSHSMK